jgi:hypothetical protein
MKIKTTHQVEKYVELPPYFRDDLNHYYMVIGEKALVRVKNTPINPEYFAGPMIEYIYPTFLKLDSIIPISEAEFKATFIKVSVLFDELTQN